MLVDFNLTQNSLSETHLQIQAAPRIDVAICFFYGPPCTHFIVSSVLNLFCLVEFALSKV